MSQEKFIQTLKTLGFSDIKKYSASDFDSFFTDPELHDFLEYFCTLNESNVLTKEELNEFGSINLLDLPQFENLIKGGNALKKEHDEDENREEEDYLKEQLNQMERQCKTMQEQKDLLKEHKSLLSSEKAKCDERNASLRKLFDDYVVNKVPQAELELNSTLKSIHELITELKVVINASTDDSILPSLNIQDVEEYLEHEERIINFIYSYLQNNFKFRDAKMLTLDIPGLSNEKIEKEIDVLSKSLKKAKMFEFKTVCRYKKKLAAEKFVSDFETGSYAYISKASSSQLNMKLDEEKTIHENLVKKEALLISYLSDAVSEHLKAQCSQVALARSKEVLKDYKCGLDKISFPLLQLMNQKIRVELLSLYFNIYERHLQSIKSLIKQASSFVECEQKSCLGKKQQYQELLKEVLAEDKLSQDSLFFSAYKILNNVHDENQPTISISNVIGELEQLFKEEQRLKGQEANNTDTIELVEKQYSSIEEFVSKGKGFSEFMEKEYYFSTQVNLLDTLIKEVYQIYNENEKYWNDKNKILQTKRNLQYARSLFVLALLDEEQFENFIEKVKIAKEYEKEPSEDT